MSSSVSLSEPTRRGALRSPAARMVALLLVALLGGLALGRFLTAESDPVAAIAPAPSSLLETISTLEDTVAVDPQNLRALQRLGIAYLHRAAEVGDPALYDAAEGSLEQAELLAPGDQVNQIGLGVLALARHDFPEALRRGLAAHEADVFDADALAVVVDAEVELGHYDDAAGHLQQMLDLKPGLAALSRTSYLRELNGDLEGALQAMEQAKVAGSGSPFDLATVTALSGNLHLAAGDLEDAEAALGEAERLAPDLVLTAIGSARLALARGDLDGAAATLQEAVGRYPHPEAVVLLGEVLQSSGRTEDAAAQFDLVPAIAALQEAAGQSVDLEMARFEADHGDPQHALTLARAAYRERATVYTADALGWSLHKSGRSRAAVPYIDEALARETVDPVLRYHAAVVFAANGDEERAAAELATAWTHRFTLSPIVIEEAASLATELGVNASTEY